MGNRQSKATMSDWKQVLNTADIRTARLIVQLQIEDAAAITSSSTDSQITSDAQLARRIFEDELKSIQGDFPGRALGQKLTNETNELEESFECAALGWKFNEYTSQVEQPKKLPKSAPTGLVPPPQDYPPIFPPIQLVKCLACTEDCHPGETIKAPCNHIYCSDCLESLFRSAMKDETLYPPRCCKKPIPMTDAKEVLSRGLISEFNNRKEEMETKDKTYCYRPQCSAFIRPYTINGTLARCPRCHETTCTDCKNKMHIGDCPKDDGVEQLMATAQENRWRRCPECKRLVELAHGCYHITCRCKHEFCYICGQQWRTCDCRRWDEARLLERARRLAPNFMPVAPAQQPNLAPPAQAPAAAPAGQRFPFANLAAQGRHVAAEGRRLAAEGQQQAAQAQLQAAQATERAVQQAAEHIRNNHECRHEAFRSYYEPNGGELDCEVCGQSFPRWLKQCKQCLTLMCVKCRHNRL